MRKMIVPSKSHNWLSIVGPAVLVFTAFVCCQSTKMSSNAKAQSARLPVNSELETARFREGTKITNQIGSFEVTGDRLAFLGGSGKTRFHALENLALERIARIISESSTKLQWIVTGTITEFRGENYLLIERALLKNDLTS